MSSSPPNKFYTQAADKTLEENIADFGAKLDAQIRKEEAQRPKPEIIRDSEEKKQQEEAHRPGTIEMSSSDEDLKTAMESLQETMKSLEEAMKQLVAVAGRWYPNLLAPTVSGLTTTASGSQASAATPAARSAQKRLEKQLNINMILENGPLPAKRARKDINYFKK